MLEIPFYSFTILLKLKFLNCFCFFQEPMWGCIKNRGKRRTKTTTNETSRRRCRFPSVYFRCVKKYHTAILFFFFLFFFFSVVVSFKGKKKQFLFPPCVFLTSRGVRKWSNTCRRGPLFLPQLLKETIITAHSLLWSLSEIEKKGGFVGVKR